MTETIHGFTVGARVHRLMASGHKRYFTVCTYEEWDEGMRRLGNTPYDISFRNQYVPVLQEGSEYPHSITGMRPNSLKLVDPITKPTVLKCSNCGGRWVQSEGYAKNRCSYCEA